MKSISFSSVNERKNTLKINTSFVPKIAYQTVQENFTPKNVLLFIKDGSDGNTYSHCKQSLSLYKKLLESNAAPELESQIDNLISYQLFKVKDTEGIKKYMDSIKFPEKEILTNTLMTLECCDRVLRNEERLGKRFNLNKIISNNIFKGEKHTVYELCSLLDTYNISPKAKFNIALENVSYAMFKHGIKDNDTITEYITEYFLTRNPIITDKEYDGYIDILENNKFIDGENSNLSYVFEAHKTLGNSFKDILPILESNCTDKECSKLISKIVDIKTEEQFSNYIDSALDLLIATYLPSDSVQLLKSICCIPLIGITNKDFVNYKLEMSKKKINIMQKTTTVNEDNKALINNLLNRGKLIDYAAFVTDGISFPSYILDESYSVDIDDINVLLEASSDDIKDIIKAFKASNDKTPFRFKTMLSRILVKSPENIIDETPDIFGCVRLMVYLGITAVFPLGLVFASVLAFISKLVRMELNLRQASKLLKYLREEKKKAESKLEKASDKEKKAQEDYIKCIDDCIGKVESFIQDIDDEHPDLSSGSDDFDLGDDDFDFNLESSDLIEFNSVYEAMELIPQLSKPDIASMAVLFDNLPETACNEFYDILEDIMECNNTNLYKDIVDNKGKNKIINEDSFIIQYEAANILKEVITEAKKQEEKKKKLLNFKKKDKSKDNKKDKDKKSSKNPIDNVKNKIKDIKDGKVKPSKDKINLNTLKLAVVNFKRKFNDLKGKEKELWKNIDIATVNLSKGIQQALTSDRREAIIKGSIIPSFSKCIKFAISVGAIGAFAGPVGAAISAIGMLGTSKVLNERERKLLYDEIDTELQVVEKQIQIAENERNMNQYRFLLNYQKKLTREKHRIKYGIHMSGRSIPEIKKRSDA